MTNLKINNTSTPYWCVVVPVEARLSITPYALLYKSGVYPAVRSVLPFPNMELLGCITSSGMDEGVREIVGDNVFRECIPIALYRNFVTNHHFVTAHPSAISLLTHNQITLTADIKAVVLKMIN